MKERPIRRRTFMGQTAAVGATLAFTSVANASDAPARPTRRIKVGVIGCGSVSTQYLPHLARCPHVELTSTCDIIPERARAQAQRYNVPNNYPHIDRMLAGAAFDLLVNLTDMQEHEHLNRQALAAGKHIWSEKPLANSLAAGQQLLQTARQRNLHLWGAPTVVNSPQFAFMARTLAARSLGTIAAAHADYGHTGPDWSAFFYEQGGGSLPDLGVYNLTTLTGLLGPARSVVAMTSVVTPTRVVRNKGKIQVAAEDNAMILMDHGHGVISHMQSGFNYFNPHGHDGSHEERHTISIVGTKGAMGLVGYDWGPRAVELATHDAPTFRRHAVGAGDYVWQQGASLAAECLATGKETLFTPEHALHVLEIIGAARESQATGRRVALRSTFRWPVIGG
jgi:predicted dehydrogenase